MRTLFLLALFTGLLLAVRLMFFGAERRRWAPTSDSSPLRRSEPAAVAFLFMFGVAGYLLVRHAALSAVVVVSIAAGLGVLWAILITRIAIAMARAALDQEQLDPLDVIQGQIGVVTVPIEPSGEGMIAYETRHGRQTLPARAGDSDLIAAGVEVCVERIDDGVAIVERWATVEARL